MDYEKLICDYVQSIVNSSCEPSFENVLTFCYLRDHVRENLRTGPWHWMGYASHLLSVMMNVGQHFLHRNPTIASNIYAEAMRLFPNTPECRVRMAEIKKREGDNHAALKYVRQAWRLRKAYGFELFPEEDLKICMDTMRAAGKVNEALELFEEILKEDPMNVDAQGNFDEVKAANEMRIHEVEKQRREKRKQTESRRKKREEEAERRKAKLNVKEPEKVVKSSKKLKSEELRKQKELQEIISMKAQETAEREGKEKQEKLKKTEAKTSVKKETESRTIGYDVDAALSATRQKKRSKKPEVKEDKVASTRNSSSATTQPVAARKVPIDEISPAFDEQLSSGSLLRCICPKCRTPRTVATRLSKCHICESAHELWYKKASGSSWSKPRAPPPNVQGSYVLCKHFVSGIRCLKTPCSFAHGPDDIEIWEICRSGGKRKARAKSSKNMKKSSSCMTLSDCNRDSGRRSRTESTSSSQSAVPFDTGSTNVSADNSGFDYRSRTQSFSSTHSLQTLFSDNPFTDGNTYDELDDFNEWHITSEECTDDDGISSPAPFSSGSHFSLPDESDDWWTPLSSFTKTSSDSHLDDAHRPSCNLQNDVSSSDDGWETMKNKKCNKKPQAVVSQCKVQICCSYCQHKITECPEPIVLNNQLTCLNCNRTEIPRQQYWDGAARRICVLRHMPSSIGYVHMCRHYERDGEHFMEDCKFAHGSLEQQLWTKVLKERKDKGAAKANGSQISYSASAVFEREKSVCVFCDISLNSKQELQRHNSERRHQMAVIEKLKREPNSGEIVQHRPPPDGIYLGGYKLCRRFLKGYCHLGNNCTYAHGDVEREHWVKISNKRTERVTLLRQRSLLLESLSQQVQREIKERGWVNVLKDSLPGVSIECGSSRNIRLDKNEEHTWVFDVRINTEIRSLLKQVALLYELHLDHFELLSPSDAGERPVAQSCLEFREENFVEHPAKHEAAVQFCVKFSSPGFGTFSQGLVLDFGEQSYVYHPLEATVEDMLNTLEPPPSVVCQIYEWSMDALDLIRCPKLLDGFDLRSEYHVPHNLPGPETLGEFTPTNYCELWHTILFIEELEIHKEIARYDLVDGRMSVGNTFQGADESLFAPPGEFFGNIALLDFLFMDEASGHLIERSVLSVIVRPKTHQSKKVYECLIRVKTAKCIVVEINPELTKDLGLKYGDKVSIDLKFYYNRQTMVEMHDVIKRCEDNQDKVMSLFIPKDSLKQKKQKSISTWFMTKKPNDSQHEAISMILHPDPTPPLLLIGPFGTGKTFTLNLACEQIFKKPEKSKVLICTHSNSAADVHLRLLHDKITKDFRHVISPLRIMTSMRKLSTIPEILRQYCLLDHNKVRDPTWPDVRKHNVIITTLAISRMLWQFYDDNGLRFTHILIDEAAQTMEPECISPMIMADKSTKVVLAGDHMQMGPVTYSNGWPSDHGPKRPLLWRLFTHYKSSVAGESSSVETSSDSINHPHVIMLTENYRCHQDILSFPSECFYGGRLKAMGDASKHPSIPSISFYTAQGQDKQPEDGRLGYYNDAEVAEVAERVEELVNEWPDAWDEESIGVLAPYHDQVKRIRNALKRKGLGRINVQTVENVQGQEFRALFISTVRTGWTCLQIEHRGQSADPDFAFLSDERLLNTAITRAKSMLAVIGDPMSLCSIGSCREVWKKYIKRCDERNAFHGCSLKVVMDYCLSNRILNPNALEFEPIEEMGGPEPSVAEDPEMTVGDHLADDASNQPTGQSSPDAEEASDVAIAREDEANLSSPRETTEVKDDERNENLTSSSSIIQNDNPDRECSSNSNTTIEASSDKREGTGREKEQPAPDVSPMNTDQAEQITTDNAEVQPSVDDFFNVVDDDDNYDEIIQALIEACKERMGKDEVEKNDVSSEDFPPLNDATTDNVPQTRPQWPRRNAPRVFSAGMRNGRIELGFHVKDSERLFRLTGGANSQPDNDRMRNAINAYNHDELLALLQNDPKSYTRCTFRIEAGRQLQCYGEVADPNSADIVIPGRVRGAYEDDIVVVEMQQNVRFMEGEVKRGCVKGVLRSPINSKERQFVCTVRGRESLGLMVPINKSSPMLMNFTKTDMPEIIPLYELDNRGKVHRVVVLSDKEVKKALGGELLFVVKLLKWRTDCPHPLGLAVRYLKHGQDFRSCMEILYEEHAIKREFDKNAERMCKEKYGADAEDWRIPIREKHRPAYREDVFTVDPPESRDLDDAISVLCLKNGNYELHVHIADVSYFVQQNTALDDEARSRGTSYYPPKPHEVVPMLPRMLSEATCSLLEGKDRLAMTLKIELKSDGTVVGKPSFERSIVRSSCRLTYSEAQQIINENGGGQNGEPEEGKQNTDPTEIGAEEVKTVQAGVKTSIRLAHQLAVNLRKHRLGEAAFIHRKDDDDGGNVEAHEMISEIMILANHMAAKYLLERFPECTPLRIQLPPKRRRVEEWKVRFQKFAKYSVAMKSQLCEETTELNIRVSSVAWQRIRDAVQHCDTHFEELVKAVCDVEEFPQLALAHAHQQRLQQRAAYTCSSETAQYVFEDSQSNNDDVASASRQNGVLRVILPEHGGESEEVARDDQQADVRGEQPSGSVWQGHASLELDAYCHFTSPIRRYIDVIVHRLIVAVGNSSQEQVPERTPYTVDDITEICDRCTFLARNCRRFDKSAKKVQLALKLQSSTTFIQAWIDEITDDSVRLFFGSSSDIETLRGGDKSIRIARLGSIKNPEVKGEEMTLEWKTRLLRLDAKGNAQAKCEEQDEETVDQLKGEEDDVEFVLPGAKWRGVLEAVKQEDQELVLERVQDLNEHVHESRPTSNEAQVSVIAKVDDSADEPPGGSSSKRATTDWYQHPNTNTESGEMETDMFYKIRKSFKPFDTVKVQLASHISRGVLSPNIQLFRITNQMHVCIEHRTFPTQCFVKPSSIYASHHTYEDIDHYLKLWKPVLMMEIATSAVREDDVITLSNLRIVLERDSQNKITLKFSLFKSFCNVHKLDIFDLNLLCVRIKQNTDTESGFWVGHFQILEQPQAAIHAKKQDRGDEDRLYHAKAELMYSSTPIPQPLLQKKFCYVTAEVICLSTPDRRRLGALCQVANTSELLEDICTGVVSKKDLDGYQLPKEDLSLCQIEPSLGFQPLNRFQKRAVHDALKKPFTLIQGPPGTGKTVTGVHIAYWFAHMNKSRNMDELCKVDDPDDEKSKQCMVFYCGPSNKSVDVVGRYLLKIPGLKILRIYGQEIERKEFPIPDRLTAFRERRVPKQLKADEELRDVSMHHVIRKHDCPFAARIRDFDDKFRVEYATSDAPVKIINEYKALITEAEEWAMMGNGVNVILSTCTAAYSPRIQLGCFALCQCIVDECGMCIEAETLCAMLASNASQVVLIGDHKQLQPIIQNNAAKDLGLEISMFERYCQDALMLEIQYRMHEEICKFPSLHFYDNKLQTAEVLRRRIPKDIPFWPQGNQFPFVFYHLEGKEETQVVTTDTGNENSKSNQKEVVKVVHLVRTLVNSDVKEKDIVVLSPYRAQCFEISEKLKLHGLQNISVSSVVASQGSEKDYVVLSLVRSLPVLAIEMNPSRAWLGENLGFITDEHQINVALTRSRRGLCIVGNANLVGVCEVWKALLAYYESKGCLVSDDNTLQSGSR